MSAKYKKSEVFSYFEKVNGDFRARSHIISYNSVVKGTSDLRAISQKRGNPRDTSNKTM